MELERYLEGFTDRDWQESDDGAGPVRFAMIGLGWWVREESIPAVADSEFCETTVLVSRTKEKAEDLASEVETVETGLSADEYHDGAATDEYDAVYVSTPNATHLEYVETAAEHGKAVLCEKPMEASVERAEAMVETADDGDVTLMVAYRMHTEPAVRRLRELLSEGLLGDVRQVRGHMSQPLLEMIPDTDQWRLDPDLAGPGATVTDLGLYPLNTARFLLEDDPEAVQAAMDSRGDAFEDVPDEHASFTLSFPDGVYAACTASQNAAQSSSLAVVGSEGTARIDPAFFPDQPRRLSITRAKNEVRTTFDQENQMREEFDYFADCLLSDRAPEGDGEHGLTDIRIIEAIYEAAERGERISL